MVLAAKQKKERLDALAWLLIIFFLLHYLQHISYALRYVKYLFPFIAGVICYGISNSNTALIKERSRIKKVIILYSCVYLINLVCCFFFSKVPDRFFANVFFVIAPIASVYYVSPLITNRSRFTYFKILFWGTVIGFLLEQGLVITKSFSSFNLAAFLLSSDSETESNLYPFIFAFLLIYSVTEKYNYKYRLALLFLVFLGSKRIILVSLAVLYAVDFFLTKIKFSFGEKHQRLVTVVFLVGSLFLVSQYFQFAYGAYDEFIEDTFQMSANHLTQGRQFLYKGVLDQMTTLDHFKGKGVGFVDNIVALLTLNDGKAKITNLHSEILRGYVELGAILFIIWTSVFVKFLYHNRFSLLALIFLFIALATDNIQIYFECMFVMYLLITLSHTNVRHLQRLQRKPAKH